MVKKTNRNDVFTNRNGDLTNRERERDIYTICRVVVGFYMILHDLTINMCDISIYMESYVEKNMVRSG